MRLKKSKGKPRLILSFRFLNEVPDRSSITLLSNCGIFSCEAGEEGVGSLSQSLEEL